VKIQERDREIANKTAKVKKGPSSKDSSTSSHAQTSLFHYDEFKVI
jgi:hypothetical protein